MENPNNGLLKLSDVVQHLPMHIIDYCQYALGTNFPGRYRKRTSIWTNCDDWRPLRPLCNPSTCHFCANNRRRDHCAHRLCALNYPDRKEVH